METGDDDGNDAGQGNGEDSFYEPLHVEAEETAPVEESAPAETPGVDVPRTPQEAVNRHRSVQSMGESVDEGGVALLPESPEESACFRTPGDMTEQQKEELAALIKQMQEVELQFLP